MKISKNITIELSEKDVQEIIATYLQENGYKVSSDDVMLSIASKTEGHHTNEHTVHYFKGAYIKCGEII